jgi:uncharacterized protein (DUF1501 family)
MQNTMLARLTSRREFLEQATFGLSTVALAQLLAEERASGSTASDSSRLTPPRATSIILLMQVGGPSQVDLFDPKQELQKRHGQAYPGTVETLQPGSERMTLLASPFRFQQHGQCGMEISELLPSIGSIADELCLVRSMQSDNNNHPQATRCLNTGKIFPGRPSLGSWISYALGSENQNLPAYVVLRDPTGYNNGGTTMWENGWLPAVHRGTEIQSRGAAVLNLHPTVSLPEGAQRATLDAIARLNEERRKLYPQESDLEARIRNYELAARMQASAEEALDLSNETAHTRRLYGLDDPTTENFGMRCLMARRLVEYGVRFIHVMVPIKSGGAPWDHHENIKPGLEALCPQVDLPTAGLVRDLKQRGLLDSTIVIWTGEFGRLPVSQHGHGRDHNRQGFSLLLAGGGFRAGHLHGATDEFGYAAVEGRVTCPDLLATLLHQLGLDHEQLNYLHQGRLESLTDAPVTHARVVSEILDSPSRA